MGALQMDEEQVWGSERIQDQLAGPLFHGSIRVEFPHL